MSLQFPQDELLSKREKQEMFRKSLDNQRRMKQESFTSEQRLPSNTVSHQAYQVSEHAAAGVPPDGLNVPRFNNVPGLEQHQPAVGRGGNDLAYAPRFEAAPSPQQEKQPYMSALSEMNGRPLHVRQQQFQKERQYRDMLKEQIAENKKKKDAEKAKLEEEKRRELEEVRRLQGMPPPRRQQHAQFQESPDHPLPSPGRLPPARHSPAPPDQLQRRIVDANMKNLERSEGISSLHSSSGRYASSDSPGIGGGMDVRNRLRDRQNLPGDDDNHQGNPGGDYGRRRSYAAEEPRQTRTTASRNDFAGNGYQEAVPQARTYPTSGQGKGFGQGIGDEEGPRGRFDAGGQLHSGEGEVAGKLSFESGRGVIGVGGAVGHSGDASDSVPRTDFEELTTLCQDLLLEQKQLRRRLEEHEQRAQIAAERVPEGEGMLRQHQQHQQHQQHYGERGIPRRGDGRTAEAARGPAVAAGRRRRVSSFPDSTAASRVQSNKGRSDVSRQNKPKPKPGVAFGSSRPRMPGPKVEKTRVAAGSKPRAPRGGRDSRVSQSEPTPKTESLSGLRRLRNGISTMGGAGGKSFSADGEASKPGWPANTAAKDDTDADGGGFADLHRPVGERWMSRDEGYRKNRGFDDSEMGHAGQGGIYGLLGNPGGRHDGAASKATETPRPSQGADGRLDCGNNGELGGESTFLAAHPMDSGF